MPRRHLPWRTATAAIAAGLLILTSPAHPAAAAETNLAAGRSATASSANSPYVAGNVLDNDQSTYWESSNNALPQWIQVDLGAAASVTRLVLRLPAAWEARTQTLTAQASPDGTSFTTLAAAAAYTFAPATANTVTINVTATTTRYVRLSITANTTWPAGQLSEFEIWVRVRTPVAAPEVAARSPAPTSPSANR